MANTHQGDACWLNCLWADGSESDYADAAERGLHFGAVNLADAEAKRLTTPPMGGAVEVNIIQSGRVVSIWRGGEVVYCDLPDRDTAYWDEVHRRSDEAWARA